MNKLIIVLIVLGAVGAGLALKLDLPLLPQRTKTIAELTTIGHEEPQEDALLVNGWLIKDYGAARVRTYWERYQPWLGEPIGAFDGRSQMFRMGKLSYTASNPSGWEIELDNLGWLDLSLHGLTAAPGSEPHPAVRAWLITQLDVGTDVTRLVGRIISPAVCDRKGHCMQWTDKTRLEFEQAAATAEATVRAPLGLYLAYPHTQPVEVPDGPILTPVQVVLGAGGALLIGLLLIGRGRASGPRPRTV